MTGHIKVSGAWKDVDTVHAKVSGAWKEIDEGYTKVGGVWKQFYSAGPPPNYEFIGSFEDVGDGPTYTFTGINIGKSGLAVISVHSEGTVDISSVTINGSTPELAASEVSRNNIEQRLYFMEVATSTIDVVVTMSGSPFRINLGVWRIDNYATVHPSITASVEGTSSILSYYNTTIIPAGSVLIAGATEANSGTMQWYGYGFSLIVEDYDTTTSENNSNFSGASIQFASEDNLNFYANPSHPSSNALTAAAWSPVPVSLETPLGTPDYTFNQGDSTFGSGETQAIFAIDVEPFTATTQGLLFEQGATVMGMAAYLVGDGTLRITAGDGSSWADDNSSWAELDITSIAGERGTFYFYANLNGSPYGMQAWWQKYGPSNLNEPVFLGQGLRFSQNNTFIFGSGGGAVGIVSASPPQLGLTPIDYQGTINEERVWLNQALPSIFPSTPNASFRPVPVETLDVFDHLETVELTSPASTITLSNLFATYGATYDDLQLRIVANEDGDNGKRHLKLRFNNDLSSSHESYFLSSLNGSIAPSEFSGQQELHIGTVNGNSSSPIYTSAIVDIYEPFVATKRTLVNAVSGGSEYTGNYDGAFYMAGHYQNKEAIDQITLGTRDSLTGTLAAGTRISLYGYRK